MAPPRHPADRPHHHRAALVFGRLLGAGWLSYAEISDAYGDMDPDALARVLATVSASAEAWDRRIDAMLRAPIPR